MGQEKTYSGIRGEAANPNDSKCCTCWTWTNQWPRITVKGDNPNQFSRTSDVGDSSILRLRTSNFGCDPQFLLGMSQGSQTRSLYTKNFCPSLPATFFPKQARANFFWRDRPNFIQFDNPTMIPIVFGGHNPKMGVLASKLTNPLHWTSVRIDLDYPL